jgi:hypothetical protein
VSKTKRETVGAFFCFFKMNKSQRCGKERKKLSSVAEGAGQKLNEDWTVEIE